MFTPKNRQLQLLLNGKDDAGRLSPSGVYVLVLNAGMATKAQKVMLVR